MLPSVQCPTLVLRLEHDTYLDERHSRYVAEHIPNARYAEVPGEGAAWFGEEDAVADEIQHFLTGVRRPVVSDRVLATVLFTDIVGSTERAAELGDGAWRSLLERHDGLVREEVERHRGRFVKSLGDGALAVFDGPEPRDQQRDRHPRPGPRPRPGDSRRPAHRRMRAAPRRRRRRARGPHRCARQQPRRTGRGARQQHRPRPHRRLGPDAGRPRRARPQRRARPVADLRRRDVGGCCPRVV